MTKFSLGQIVATPSALEALAASSQAPEFFISKHQSGDWGLVGEEDRRLNEEALANGDSITSAYKTLRGTKIWLITEPADANGNRATTTIHTAEDF
jgi:hypothetical protein